MRREGQIGEIQTGLEGDLAQQEQYRQTIQEQVANQAAQRAGEMTADQAARVKAGREALGPQVTSEFEEVAALTGGLTGSQAMSTTAGMDRLAQVANQAAAQRLAAPAQLAAEAKMAVGDERFRLENQLQQQLATGLAELNFDSGSSSQIFDGEAKAVAVYKTALTDTELANLTSYNNHDLFIPYRSRMQMISADQELQCTEHDITRFL